MSVITEKSIREFEQWLIREERQPGTIEKYLRDVRELSAYLSGAELTKELLAMWKDYLLKEKHLCPVTVNSKLSAVDTYCKFTGIGCHVKFYKIQKKLFSTENRNLRKEEYLRLIETARRTGKHRLALIMETIGATGIRVSEVQYITMEAAQKGVARIHLKGKIRTILIPGKLCGKLIKYAQKNKITSGEIFITRSGKRISRKQIWAEMKALCIKAGVEKSKVFPHNLRHLFARLYFRATHDIAKLADVLGHSAIETTRIYLLTTEQDHARQLERLGLVV